MAFHIDVLGVNAIVERAYRNTVGIGHEREGHIAARQTAGACRLLVIVNGEHRHLWLPV